MAFDDNTRNRLQKFVSDARRVLTEEFTAQLQNDYGLDPVSGNITPLESLADDPRKETAQLLRQTYEHYRASTPNVKPVEVLERLVREQAFTVLNRLVALRMCEERRLLEDSIKHGASSRGFQLYERLAGPALGERAEAYRAYLLAVFDEFTVDLGVLFDRFAPSGLLFPGPKSLDALLTLINAPDLEPLWSGDETIGWIYQYFNTQEERQKMRKDSPVPRNSRELAVRNQFFTPRYVVEFLVDNTLGRIWIEMMAETRLTSRCRFFVKPLEDDEPRPPRAKKDPRDLKILDPACGSGHFLLYAFDLLVDIYEESWSDPEAPQSTNTGDALRVKYETERDLHDHLPELILRHNLYGVDIDPRAAQIAQLALWMRAQRAWSDLGIARRERPLITRTNIVVAEPMPGERALKEEFLASLDPMLARVTASVFDRMQFAGDLGVLLRMEQEIRNAMRETYKDFGALFESEEAAKWVEIESRLFAALREYGERAEGTRAYGRRLFAEDAQRGIALIDICRERYDVVLMNPPFGEAVEATRVFVDTFYPEEKSDFGMVFVARGCELLAAGGLIGVLGNRVFLSNDSLESFRVRFLLGGESELQLVADLGYGVLDGAKVEAAAFVVARRGDGYAKFIRLLDEPDKARALALALGPDAPGTSRVVRKGLERFLTIPGRVIAYQLPSELLSKITGGRNLASLGGTAAQGLIPADDFRFVRLAWEVHPSSIGRSRKWCFYAKGGEYQPYWDDIHLLVRWENEGDEIKNLTDNTGKLRSRPQGISRYFGGGVTYPERTTSDFSPRPLPKECIFSATGQGIFCGDSARDVLYIAGAYARPFKMLVDAIFGSGDASSPGSMATHYRCGVFAKIPPPLWSVSDEELKSATALVRLAKSMFDHDETARTFRGPRKPRVPLASMVDAEVSDEATRFVQMIEHHLRIEAAVTKELGFSDADCALLDMVVGSHPAGYARSTTSEVGDAARELWSLSESDLIGAAIQKCGARRQLTMKSYAADRRYELVAHILQTSCIDVASAVARLRLRSPGQDRRVVDDLLSWCVGAAFGRFDVGAAAADSSSAADYDLFAVLPIVSPGSMAGSDGLPLKTAPSAYPVQWPEDGLLVDDAGNRRDVVAHVQEVLRIVFGERADETERELCAILGTKSFRDWMRKPANFFADHLARYSKSRRQAPIYWPLSTASGSYTIWLYIHRLTDQTLFLAVNELVEPKLRETEDALRLLRAKGSARTKSEERELEALEELESELCAFRDELLRVAAFWKPDLDDGVVITAAPLWKLFRLPKWQRTLKETWQKLERGDYDWAHLAYAIRPNEVREKCRTDKSLAIAHGLEELYIEPPKTATKRGRRDAAADASEELGFEE